MNFNTFCPNAPRNSRGSHCLILDLTASNDLLLFMALGTKNDILGAPNKVHCVT